VNLELSGKTALVTGGSQGIGRAIAFGLGGEGAKVAICARDKARLEETAKEIQTKTSAEVLVVPGDLSRLDEVNRVATAVRDRFGRLDILVNNAGAIRGGDFLKIPDEQWAGDWSLKILGYVRMARAVFPIMQAQGGGRIVNVVGAAARNPTPGYLPGGIANSGLINFSKGLADLGAPSNILVTAVSPAATATARWEGLIAQQAAAAGGHRRSRVLPGIGARRVHYRRLHHRGRRGDPRSLSVISLIFDLLDMRHPLSYILAPPPGGSPEVASYFRRFC